MPWGERVGGAGAADIDKRRCGAVFLRRIDNSLAKGPSRRISRVRRSKINDFLEEEKAAGRFALLIPEGEKDKEPARLMPALRRKDEHR